MRKRHQRKTSEAASGGFENLPANTDFYTGSPTEQPLYQDKKITDARRTRKTGRHQAVGGRKKEKIDPREKMALIAILKSVVMIMMLGLAFFMLKKGISLYEESIWLENQAEVEASPVLQEVAVVHEFDIESQDSRAMFAERVETWKEAERLVRSAAALEHRDNFEQAIMRCQDALKIDPSHIGALEYLGRLYRQQGRYVESINAYMRLLNINPAREDLQESLIEVLDAYDDSDAVIYMARWYLEQNHYDRDVQRYLANALFGKEEYADAVDAYARVLKDNPKDYEALEQQGMAYIILERYNDALEVYEKLRVSNYREQRYYRQLAVCHAQLGHSQETVQTLGKAAHLFGQKLVVSWVQDPRLDPVRTDRTFQAFAERVGGEEFRKWLEQVARTMEPEERKEIAPQLTLPEEDGLKTDLLKPRD
jgi:tetratricopeptide (TPR) repeat protein